MRLINKNIYYAVRSLLYIAQKPDATTSVTELVTKLKMRRAFLRRILQVLSKRKILKSLKGKGGGFVLNIKPSNLRILDIVKVFRGKLSVMDCLLEKNVCPYPNDCALMAKMKDIERKLYRTLETTTIAVLLRSRGREI